MIQSGTKSLCHFLSLDDIDDDDVDDTTRTTILVDSGAERVTWSAVFV